MTSKKNNKKKTTVKQESNIFYVSRDKLCPSSLDYEDSSCKLPPNHRYESTYTVVYHKAHLERKNYECGCIVYNNKHYYEFKFPEAIWMDFFHEGVELGEKNVKFSVRKCFTK